LKFGNGKESKFIVLTMRLYSQHHLKEPIYDKQFVVKFRLVNLTKSKDLEFLCLLLLANGTFLTEDTNDSNITILEHIPRKTK
jgi:hypothetical protein